MRYLEMEKNKIIADIGSKRNVRISEDYDASTVWETLSILASSVTIYDSFYASSLRDQSAYRSFES